MSIILLVIKKYLRKGKIKWQKIGKLWWISKEDLPVKEVEKRRITNEGKVKKIGTSQEVLIKEIIQKVYGVRPILINHPDLKVSQVII